MKKLYFITLAAIVAMMVSCAKENNDSNSSEVVDNTPKVVMSLSVNAQKAEDLSAKALGLSGSALNAFWGDNDEVKVYKKGNPALIGTLAPQTSGSATAVLAGGLTETVSVGDVLSLVFPREVRSYSGQIGTLADIAENFDYAIASVSVESVDGSKVSASDASFVNQQAIVKFTLKDKGNNDALISASKLTIFSGNAAIVDSYYDGPVEDATLAKYSDCIEINPSSASSELFVALKNGSGSDTYSFTAKVGSDTYTYTRSGVSFASGEYREITLKMTKADEIYTVAGSPAAIFGTEWDPGNTANDMIKTENGYIKKFVNNSGSDLYASFKVATDNRWGIAEYPADNYDITVPAGRELIITFNNPTVTATISDYYVVAGEPASVFGSTWNATSSANLMARQADGTYSKTYYNLSEGTTITFKVVRSGSEWIPAADNVYFTMPVDGDCVITYNPSTGSVEAHYSPCLYTVAADFTNWAIDSANDMVLQPDGTYLKTISGVSTGNHELKVVQDRSWDYSWPGGTNKPFYVVTAGDVTVSFNPASGDVYAWDSSEYTVAGDGAIFGTDWDTTSQANTMTRQSDGSYVLEKAFTQSDYSIVFKVVANHSWDYSVGASDSDNPTGDGNGNCSYYAASAGTIRITFNPQASPKITVAFI
ncbi:MAG: hypothetical protein IKR69_06920 [Bacteroidales bacterium]|nr:hypothetical protein [Bacteroidales bacterium]